ncbi:helicase C-terminal domain-containing protein [Ruania zhangjianzhongii]|uniref:helicase C-terminal domain-containing protein n=1 Tax=Ruania zhangjianzhongii TaxID=2603206 RepID=UPI0011C8BC23|nr:helicase C-terminal domain-containing protein [Ruania zhangjianzhongii]
MSAWLPMSLAPTLERDPDGTYLTAFGRAPADSGLPVGLVLCRLLSTLPGEGVVSADDVAALLRWYHPVANTVPGSIEHTWAEAHQLGLFADGALTPLGAAVSTGDNEAATELLDQVLPAQSNQVMFGSDLTIVIPGSPDPAAVDLLDVLAAREGHGVVGTWRVSEGSVRGALDSGYAVEDLIVALRRLAGQDLPQALEYLLRDVARKHGHLEVRPAAAVITSADEPLLAEVVASKSVRTLGLSMVAPTVAVSDRPVEQVLASLRKAGYLPVEMDDGGAPVVQLRRPAGMAESGEPAEPGDTSGPGAGLDDLDEVDEPAEDDFQATVEDFLASIRGEQQPSRPRPEPETAAEVAQRLITGAGAPDTPGEEGGLEQQIAADARHLTSAEVHELADAVQQSRPVQIRYRSAADGVSMRVVSELEVLGGHLAGYCHSKQGDRTFRLDQILAVSPAPF